MSRMAPGKGLPEEGLRRMTRPAGMSSARGSSPVPTSEAGERDGRIESL